MKLLASDLLPEKIAGRLPIRCTSAAWGTTANGLAAWPAGFPGPSGPPGPLPGFLCRALLIAVVICSVGVGVVVVPLAVVPPAAVVGAVVVIACTVIVGWVRVVLIAVRVAGDNFSRVLTGLFQMIEASKDVSLFNSSSVE